MILYALVESKSVTEIFSRQGPMKVHLSYDRQALEQRGAERGWMSKIGEIPKPHIQSLAVFLASGVAIFELLPDVPAEILESATLTAVAKLEEKLG